MVRLSDIMRASAEILRKSGIDSPEFDVRCIAEDITGMSLAQLMLDYNRMLSDEQEKEFLQMVEKRSKRYPLQYILGEWEFYGLPFRVGEGVLIPRPDTETLVDAVLEHFKGMSGLRIADLCSGSGCIAVAIEKNIDSLVYALELSEKAYGYLEKNITINNSKAKPVRADVLSCDTAAEYSGLDAVVSNPPYLTSDDMENLQREVSYEPQSALYGLSSDGLEFYRRIAEIWRDSLKSGGLMAFEVGIGQEGSVSDILLKNGFADIKIYKDAAGISRVAAGIKP